MSVKKLDSKNRWRNKMVCFRVSPEEDIIINKKVAISGLPKREYCYQKIIGGKIIVEANTKVYKALRNELGEILKELKEKENISDELIETINFVAEVLKGFKGHGEND